MLKRKNTPSDFAAELAQLITDRKNIYTHQRDVLLEAIDAYLHWRNNKNTPDDRGYPVTFFTWLRHTPPLAKSALTP